MASQGAIGITKSSFRGIVIFSSLQDRLRSRTRVRVEGKVMESSLKESAPFSHKCHSFQVPDCVKFEEWVPFSHICHNC